ncbi:MAG: class II aldolase/adducin family protein [Clostridiaceae bacterium]|jgi:ribulose-5-phosphate 4-epimerase/fuculose-1-phosphate aldolase|nr:class II aldolase/adducin family protein [Clostridiaceae bacterium]
MEFNYKPHITKLIDSGITPHSGDAIAFIQETDIYVSKYGANLAELSDDDFIVFPAGGEPQSLDSELAELCTLLKPGKTAAFVKVSPRYSASLAGVRTEVPAVLDDMAQIVGLSLRYSPDYKHVKRRMRTGRTCALLPDKSLLATGRTLDEAVIAALVAEKSARVFVQAQKIGGAKSLGLADALLMRLVYKLKYSKKNIETHKES